MPIAKLPASEYERELEENVDQLYKQDSDNRPLLHWIQKEAIQNSLDEIRDRDEFAVYFELKENRSGGELDRYLIIRDRGTSGMTGIGIPEDIQENSEEIKKFLSENQNEKWGRFESFYYPKENYLSKLGSKGRGKLVFIFASMDLEIFFDSLREDNTYKFGGILWKSHDRIIAKPGEESIKELKTRLPFLEPLNEVGTRIIIKAPKSEVTENFSKIEEYVQETWWEVLNQGIRIFFKGLYDQTFKQIKPNQLFNFNNIPDENKVEYKNLKFGKNKEYKCKELVIALSDKKLDEYTQGIWIQRRGMKITNYKPSQLPSEALERIFGYMTFSKETEEKFVEEKIESITHYKYRRDGLGKAIDDLLDSEVRNFAERMGLLNFKEAKLSRRETRIVKNEEEKFNKLLKKLGLFGGKGLGENNKNVENNQQKIPPISVIKEPALKEEYDENETLHFAARVINNSLPKNQQYIVEFKLYKDTVASGTLVYQLFVGEYAHLDKAEIKNISSYQFKENDPIGKYLVNCRIINKTTGEEVYNRSDVIWYKTPPEKRGGPLKLDISEMDPNSILYRVEIQNGSYLLRINSAHIAYRKASASKILLPMLVNILEALALPKIIQDSSKEAYGIKIQDIGGARETLESIESLIGNALKDILEMH
jgi:hypothetical protein